MNTILSLYLAFLFKIRSLDRYGIYLSSSTSIDYKSNYFRDKSIIYTRNEIKYLNYKHFSRRVSYPSIVQM